MTASSPADQAFASDRMKLVVCTLNPALPPAISSLLKQLHAQAGVDFERVSKIEEASRSISRADRSAVVMSLSEKEELVSILTFLKNEESRILQGTLRVIVLSRMNHPKILSALRARGVSDVVEFHVTAKALNLKIKNQFLLAHQALDRISSPERRAGGASSPRDRDPLAPRPELPSQVTWEPAFEHPCDFWVMTTKKHARFVMGRWLVEMLGPGPSAGTWESTDLTWRGEIGWQWKPRVSTDTTFQKAEGSWVYFGRVPEFIWQKNLWSFVGKFPTLAFYSGEKIAFHRMKCEQNQALMIRENSESSKAMLDAIMATMETSVRLSDDRGAVPRGGTAAGTGDSQGAQILALLDSSTSSALPTPAWQEHMDTPGVKASVEGILGPDRSKEGRGKDLLQPGTLGRELGFTDLSKSNWKGDATAFETLQLTLTANEKNGAALMTPSELRFLDYRDGEVLFDAESGIFRKNDALSAEATLVLGARRTSASLIGQVSWVDGSMSGGAGTVASSTASDEKRCLISVQLQPDCHKPFETILRIFQERQIELNHFFRRAKGA